MNKISKILLTTIITINLYILFINPIIFALNYFKSGFDYLSISILFFFVFMVIVCISSLLYLTNHTINKKFLFLTFWLLPLSLPFIIYLNKHKKNDYEEFDLKKLFTYIIILNLLLSFVLQIIIIIFLNLNYTVTNKYKTFLIISITYSSLLFLGTISLLFYSLYNKKVLLILSWLGIGFNWIYLIILILNKDDFYYNEKRDIVN
ncbi:hypothetical protein [Spiroplasma turonicum]|uniref:Transmembrane protein n=1 Tax=Spiroplasma turonicum TaxID=216946 RepID=A0A0K1P808_9MOLU|nr:hypothetical protein [Spiroplasma turonicum]AKU80007.1 hypothetical protein STURON_00761 [Spiroplasma turonicum]ALX71009.1 hypothetical protein STURO_v1c07580 [Spiroplasma turonicum]